jgi:hypothetical protein
MISLTNMAASNMAFPLTSKLALKTLSGTRMLVGAGFLLLPSTSSRVFGIDFDPRYSIIARVYAIRELALGAYLYLSITGFESSLSTQEQKRSDDKTSTLPEKEKQDQRVTSFWLRRQLQHATWLGVVCDSVDVGSAIVCIWEGNLTGLAIPLIGAGAAAFGLVALTGIRE